MIRTNVLAGLSILLGGMASLSAPGFAQQLPAPGQLEQYLPPLAPPPTPAQAAQADQMAATFVEQGQWQGYQEQDANAGVSSIVPIIEPQLLTGVTHALDSAKSTTMANILAEASVNGVLGGGQALATRPDYTGLLGFIPLCLVETLS